MANPYKIGGTVLILISIAISIGSYKKFMTFKYGKIVEVDVLEIPIPCEYSNKHSKAFFRFSYNGKKHTKNIKGKYCQILKKEKTIKLKTNSDHSVFVYLDENLTMNYVAIISLFLIGSFFLIKKTKE